MSNSDATITEYLEPKSPKKEEKVRSAGRARDKDVQYGRESLGRGKGRE
jgi:hypothetical protein